jgi:hypothetical protein
MMRSLLVLLAFLFAVPTLHAQDEPVVPVADKFQVAVAKAVRSARKNGDLSVRQAIKLRVALISPAFKKKAEDLAVTQMAFGQGDGDAPLPRTEAGAIDRAAIDWDGLIGFLEKLLPLLLQLLDAFASADLQMQWVGGAA